MSENLTREELERRIEELEKTLERISAQEAASGSRLDKLSKLAGIDLALRCSPRRDIVLWEVLGRVLEIFDCDRAWLLSPCDPAAASWSVRMERTVPEYPGAMEQAGEIGMTPDMAEMFRRALAASAPVAYGPGGLPLAESTKNWRVQSHLSMALRTNTGAPWQFGLHQCSYPRSWSPEEKDLFRKIGYRITATLNLLDLAASARREDLSVDSAPDDMRTVSARDETLRLLEAQATLGQKLAASRSLQASLDTCLRSAIETTGMDAGGIYLFGDGGEATLEAQMNLSPEFAGRVARESLNTPLGRRVAGGAGLFLTPADVPERLRKILEDEGIVSLGVIPIASEGRLIGCMNIASKTNEKIDEKIRHALEVVAQTAGSAIERIRAGEQLRLTHASLLALVEHADDHIAIYDHEGGPVLWNRAYADIVKELLGIDVKQGIKPHTLLKDPAAVAWWEELHRRVLGGEGFRVEYEHGEGAGARYFEVSYSPIIEEGQVKGFAEVTREITDRRKAEDALRESEERSRNLVSNLALGVSRLAPDGTILYSNPSHDRTFGYDPGELQGRSLFDLVPAGPERQKAKEYFGKLAGGDAAISPWAGTCMRRDGSPVDVRVDWAYRKDAMGKVKGFTAIVTDVTERRRALRALRESEEKFRSLAEESPNMIFIESAGRIIYGNRQCETRMGYERASLYSGGIIFDDIVDPGDREAVAAYHRDLHEGRDASPVDCRMTTRGGETFYAIVSSRTIDYHGSRALLTIATDITARREAEEALKESEERYRRLVEESHEIIITMDSAGNLVLANPAFTSVTGWEAEEWLGRPFRELVHPDFRAASDEYFSALRSGEKLPAGEVTLLTRSGESIILEYSSVPIIKDDLFDGAWCIGRDITGRRKAEEDERHLSALREREGVSRWLHDHLGADLYNVILLADSIQRRGNVGSGVREQLGWITDTSRQALASIRNYLDFSGNAAGSFTDLLGSMEEYGASILSPLGIDFTLERRGDLDKVTLTAIQSFNVYLIFKEALTNVVKHSEASRVTALAACEGDVLTITVKDNGRGVARERIGKGYGTMNIRARAEELGATLAIGPLPEGGTRISMSIRAKA